MSKDTKGVLKSSVIKHPDTTFDQHQLYWATWHTWGCSTLHVFSRRWEGSQYTVENTVQAWEIGTFTLRPINVDTYPVIYKVADSSLPSACFRDQPLLQIDRSGLRHCTVSEWKEWQRLGEWQLFSLQDSYSRPTELPKDKDSLENTTEISALAHRTRVLPRETVSSNSLFSSIPHGVLFLGTSAVFQLGTETENNTFPPCCIAFPLPQLDRRRRTQRAVHFAYALLGSAQFVTQKTFSSDITKRLENRAGKPTVWLWQHSVKYQRKCRWLWLHFLNPLLLAFKILQLRSFCVCEILFCHTNNPALQQLTV